MGIGKLFYSFIFLCLLSSSAIAKTDEKEAHQRECDKLTGSIFAVLMIAGVPPEVAGNIANKKGRSCKEDMDLRETINFVQGLTQEYLFWRRVMFDCSYIVGKISNKNQTIGGDVIKDFELDKINDCVEEVLKQRDAVNKKL